MRTSWSQSCHFEKLAGVGIIAEYGSADGRSSFAVLTELYTALSAQGWQFQNPSQLVGNAVNDGWTLKYTVEGGTPIINNGKPSTSLTGISAALVPPNS
jgi:hypothetical protein